VKAYRFASYGDYRIWPGPNSNTFVATVLRAVPGTRRDPMPPNAIGRDFRPVPYLGLTDSGPASGEPVGLIRHSARLVEGVEVTCSASWLVSTCRIRP